MSGGKVRRTTIEKDEFDFLLTVVTYFEKRLDLLTSVERNYPDDVRPKKEVQILKDVIKILNLYLYFHTL